MDDFFAVYLEELTRAVRDYPQEYSYSLDNVPKVAQSMRAAIVAGTYSKDSRAFKATCKRLQIAHTYKAIKEFITNH